MLGRLGQAIADIWRHPRGFLISSVGFLVAFFLVHLPHGPEHWTADRRIAHFSDRHDRQHPKIAVIHVSEAEVDALPFASPVSRRMLGDLVAAIDAAGAKAIGLDFIFDRHTTEEDDKY